jgi:poly(A) polymerase
MNHSVPARLETLLDEGVTRLISAFREAGHDLYLVGGTVRDLFLGRPQTDIDFATDALPDEIEKIAREFGTIWLAGKEFGTVGLDLAGTKVEITTFRSDVYPRDSRKPQVTFGRSIEEDLRRRDFTINAMAISLPSMQLVDPWGGAVDLHEKKLRTPIPAEQALDEDPLRMLRVARFVSQLRFTPDKVVVEAVRKMRKRLGIVSRERIRDEFSRLLLGDGVDDGLWLLVDTKLAEEFIPEIPALRLEQDPIHRHKDVLAHTIAVTAKVSSRLRLRLAALFHDVGKPATRAYEKGKVTFHHHEVVGARMTERRLRELRYPDAVVEDVRELVYLHLRFHTYGLGWTDRAVRRYVRDAGPLLDDLNELVRCDCTTRNRRKAEELAKRMDQLEQRISELREKEELAKIRPPLDGHQVMEFLGIEPGPLVGEALDYLLEVRLDEGPVPEDVAYEKLSAWAAERGIDIRPRT